MKNEDYLYRVLTEQEAVFPKIDKALRRLGVSAEYCLSHSERSRIYRVARAEVDVLPNLNGPRLPVSGSKVSYTIGKMPDVDRIRSAWRCSEWREI